MFLPFACIAWEVEPRGCMCVCVRGREGRRHIFILAPLGRSKRIKMDKVPRTAPPPSISTANQRRFKVISASLQVGDESFYIFQRISISLVCFKGEIASYLNAMKTVTNSLKKIKKEKSHSPPIHKILHCSLLCCYENRHLLINCCITPP